MNTDELRRACEMAGLHVICDEDGWFVTVMGQNDGEPWEYVYESDDPALPGYVAELLKPKLHEKLKGMTPHQKAIALAPFRDSLLYTAEHAVCACMEALK